MAKITATLAGNITPFATAMAKAQAMAGRTASNISGRLKSFVTTPLGAAAAGVSAFFTYKTFSDGIKGVIDSGAALHLLNKQTGMNVAGLSTLRSVFGEAEVDSELLTMAVARMQNTLFKAAQGGRQSRVALEGLGIPIDKLLRARPDQQIGAIGRALARIEDPIERGARAIAIFGGAGQALLPAFEVLASKDVGGIGQKAQIMAKNAELFHRITIGFRKASANLQNLFIGMAVGLAPAFEKVSGFISQIDLLATGNSIGKALAVAIPIVGGILVMVSKVGGLLRNAVTGFLGVLANPMATLGTLGAGLNMVMATAGNYFLAAVKYPVDYLRNFFNNLGLQVFPLLGRMFYNALGAAAENLNGLLINAGLDFLNTVSRIPGMGDIANKAAAELIPTGTAAQINARKYGNEFTSASREFGGAFAAAGNATKFAPADIFGAEYWKGQMGANAASVMASGKGQEKLIGGFWSGIFNGAAKPEKKAAPWQPKTGLEKSWIGLYGRKKAEQMALAKAEAENLDPSAGWSPSTSGERQRVALLGRRRAWETMTEEGKASVRSRLGGGAQVGDSNSTSVMQQMLKVLQDMSGTMEEAWSQ